MDHFIPAQEAPAVHADIGLLDSLLVLLLIALDVNNRFRCSIACSTVAFRYLLLVSIMVRPSMQSGTLSLLSM
jgi:hypothetical protein